MVNLVIYLILLKDLFLWDENHTRYEPIHDTENFNSAPGCNKTCDFNANDEYIGPKNTDMMGNKCLSWNQFNDEELKIDNQQINEVLKMDGFKKDFLKDVRQQLKNGKQFGNKCLSLDDTKEPVCVVNDKGKNVLRKCFPDFLDKDGNNVKVINNDTCVDYLKEFTSRYGPIDANNCLGDNDDRTLTIFKEIKKGVLGEKDCVFECDPRFSYRRANIHQRQMVFKFNNFTREEDKIPRKERTFL